VAVGVEVAVAVDVEVGVKVAVAVFVGVGVGVASRLVTFPILQAIKLKARRPMTQIRMSRRARRGELLFPVIVLLPVER
jgi:hypothetical protein